MFTYPVPVVVVVFFFLIERSKGASEEEMGRLSPFLPLRARVPFFSFRPKKNWCLLYFYYFLRDWVKWCV